MRLYTWGTKLHGESGEGLHICTQRLNGMSSDAPQEVAALRGISVQKVAAGDSRSLALTADGEVYQWGRVFGRPMDDMEKLKPRMFLWSDVVWSPEKVPTPFSERVVDVVCGYHHFAVITQLAELYAAGSNKFGQLGVGHTVSSSRLQKVSFSGLAIRRFRSVSLGKYHSCAVVEHEPVCFYPVSPRPSLFNSFDSAAVCLSRAIPLEQTQMVSLYVWGKGSSSGALGLGQELGTSNSYLSAVSHCDSWLRLVLCHYDMRQCTKATTNC